MESIVAVHVLDELRALDRGEVDHGEAPWAVRHCELYLPDE
jgi:hypothetical protein